MAVANSQVDRSGEQPQPGGDLKNLWKFLSRKELIDLLSSLPSLPTDKTNPNKTMFCVKGQHYDQVEFGREIPCIFLKSQFGKEIIV